MQYENTSWWIFSLPASSQVGVREGDPLFLYQYFQVNAEVLEPTVKEITAASLQRPER
jgi:hypothetical protein